MAIRPLRVGDPLPWVTAKNVEGGDFRLQTLAGRPILLVALGSSAPPAVAASLRQLADRAGQIAGGIAQPVHLMTEPADQGRQALAAALPGPVLHDPGLAVAEAFGQVEREGANRARFAPMVWLLDQRLQVAAALPADGSVDLGARVLAAIAALPPPDVEVAAPVLVVPRLFEPEFCARLVALYQEKGGVETGFMRSDAAGRTIEVVDRSHKRRSDLQIEDEGLRQAINARLLRRLVPEIARAYQFQVTRIERHIVACYTGEDGGFFRPHRDNTTKGTAHRRFACSINLDTTRHEGGDLRFPEFGPRTYRPPSGGAVVFSCSLMHEATPVTAGERYCVLPFLYDEAAAKVREANLSFIVTPTSASVGHA